MSLCIYYEILLYKLYILREYIVVNDIVECSEYFMGILFLMLRMDRIFDWVVF